MAPRFLEHLWTPGVARCWDAILVCKCYACVLVLHVVSRSNLIRLEYS